MSGGRRAARRTALFLLYQWDLTGQPLASLYEGEIDPFARELAEAVVARRRRARPRDHRGGRRAGRPTGSARSSATSCGSRSTSSTAARCPLEVAINEAVDAREALRVRRRGAPRERHPGPDRAREARAA